MLLKGPRSHTSNNRLLVGDKYPMLLKGPRSHGKGFTSLQLVLHVFNYFDHSSHVQI
jgi:hypothetical protein